MIKSTEKKYLNRIINCLKSLGIKKNDAIFCHSRMIFFKNFNIKDSKKICDIFLNCFLKLIGKNGVFSVPLFTYDHAKKKLFSDLKSGCREIWILMLKTVYFLYKPYTNGFLAKNA